VAPLARSPPVATHSRARVGKGRRRGIGAERNELGLAWASARGFLIGRNPRAAVDLDRTATVEPPHWATLGPGGEGKTRPGPRLSHPKPLARAGVSRIARAGP
jgi:hypothetical protein